MGEFYFKNYFLSEEEIEENKQNISGNTEICGNDTLKPNLKNKISLFVNKTSDYYDYYFKLSENKITQISRKRKFPDEDKNMTKYNTERLKLLGEAISKYYSVMITYFQEKVSELDIEKLYLNYSADDFMKVENILKEMTLFYTKMYYKYPISENRKSSKDIEEILKKYNIEEQIQELERTLNLIRNIARYQIRKKEEQIKEKEKTRSNLWNISFAVIGIIIGVVQIIQAFK